MFTQSFSDLWKEGKIKRTVGFSQACVKEEEAALQNRVGKGSPGDFKTPTFACLFRTKTRVNSHKYIKNIRDNISKIFQSGHLNFYLK